MWADFNNLPPQISGLPAGELFYEKEKSKAVWQNRHLPQALTTASTWTQGSPSQEISGALSGISLGQMMLFNVVQNYSCCNLFDVNLQSGLHWLPVVLGEWQKLFPSNFVSHRKELSHQGSAGVCLPSRASFIYWNRISQIGWYSCALLGHHSPLFPHEIISSLNTGLLVAVSELFAVHFRSNTDYEAVVTIFGMLEEKPCKLHLRGRGVHHGQVH